MSNEEENNGGGVELTSEDVSWGDRSMGMIDVRLTDDELLGIAEKQNELIEEIAVCDAAKKAAMADFNARLGDLNEGLQGLHRSYAKGSRKVEGSVRWAYFVNMDGTPSKENKTLVAVDAFEQDVMNGKPIGMAIADNAMSCTELTADEHTKSLGLDDLDIEEEE